MLAMFGHYKPINSIYHISKSQTKFKICISFKWEGHYIEWHEKQGKIHLIRENHKLNEIIEYIETVPLRNSD